MMYEEIDHDLRWILRSAECEAAIVPAPSGEWIVTALKLPSYLFVSRSSARNKHHVKSR